MKSRFFKSNAGIAVLSLLIAAAIWLPVVHILFQNSQAEYAVDKGIPSKARAMAKRHLAMWRDPKLQAKELETMRRSNAEWDFMGRTFFVMSLAEMCLRDPELKSEYLPVADVIIDETLRLERQHGMEFFLMPYAKSQPYEVQPRRSLFIDGEIAMMIAVRRMVEEKPGYKPEFTARENIIEERIRQSPRMVVESYPNECWLFDHAMALAALRLGDYLDGSNHTALLRDWVANAKEKLTDSVSGLLLSSYTVRGEPLDGPEGSSIWCALHCLRLVDDAFARDQYNRARSAFGREFLGFAWSREWPSSWKGATDVDSGAIVPLLEASAGASGLAFVGAASFNDAAFLKHLHTSLEFSGFPAKAGQALRYCASNQVGDSVLLYSMVLGPIWQKVLGGQ